MAETWFTTALQALTAHGHRITEPRRAIVAQMAACDPPFTAEQLVEAVRAAHPPIGRATIYRTIELLLSERWLTRLHHADGGHAYSPAQPHSHQLVCTGCGASVAFAECDVEGLLQELARRTGFAVAGHRLEAFGLCPACRERP